MLYVDLDEKNILIEAEKEWIILDYVVNGAKAAAKESKKYPGQPVPTTPVQFSAGAVGVKVRLMDWGAGCFNDKHRAETIYPAISRLPE